MRHSTMHRFFHVPVYASLLPRIIKIFVLFAWPLLSFSQGVYAPLNPDYYHLIDRYEIRSGKFAEGIFTTYKPTLRKDIARLADTASTTQNLSKADKFNIDYLKNDNWEWYSDSLHVGDAKKKALKFFYTKKNAALHYRSKDFEVMVSPVINFEQSSYNSKYYLSLNTRGLEVRGLIGKKIGFYTFLSDNQAFYPDYVNQHISDYNALPNEGFYKTFNTYGYDFFSARGYITFNIIKQINVQFGHDKNFIGNGYRSMFLSDYSAKYLFLKLTTKIWRFNYTNLFTQMTAQNTMNNGYYPKKYMALHHLSFNFSKNFNMGVFEAISFSRSDSTTGSSGFDLNYLNPIIFYREVESYLGSEDKAMIGLDLKWNFAKHFSLYGQLALNEFVFKNLVKQNGWWGNKYAWQIGLKYIDAFGVKNLDFQLEHNFARPFMYQDKQAYTGFSNYNQPIANPLGANFYEFIALARYQPLPRLMLTGKAFYMVYGLDKKDGYNYGGNVNESYTNRNPALEYGNVVGQGIKTTTVLLSLNASYQVFHNGFIDLRQTIRNQKNSEGTLNTIFTTIGIRLNIGQRLNEY